jgi:thiol-disulfide isomerase/thioredoxin/tetratricopeptide (TPR) repeat protein
MVQAEVDMRSLGLVLMVGGAAHAGDESLSDARYAMAERDFADAARAAAARLGEDASDLRAHDIYLQAGQRRGEGHRLVAQYREWSAESDAVERRVALALALSSQWEKGSWCDEMAGLALPADATAHLRFWSLKAEVRAGKTCETGTAAATAALVELAATDPLARRHVAVASLSDPAAFGAAEAAALQAVWEADPLDLRLAASLFKDEFEGRDVKRARKAALARAKAALSSGDRAGLLAASRVFDAAGDLTRQEAALEALAELHPPDEAGDEVAEPGPDADLMSTIYDAQRKPTHQLALDNLDAIADQIPETGPERATWAGLRAGRLQALGQSDAAMEALLDAHRSDPDNPRIANQFAYEASMARVMMDEALVAIDLALGALRERTYDASRFDGWAEGQRSQLSGYLDTKGWLLHAMGRDEEALPVFVDALLYADGGVQQAHLGLVYLALGDREHALEHVARGVALGMEGDPVESDAIAALEDLFADAGYWHAGGAHGWAASILAKPDDAGDTEDEGHPLLGQAFPFSEYGLVEGGTRAMPEATLTVVDMWATWCGPCVAGMPHLQAVAEEYASRDVAVVGLSVDATIGPVKKFFRGADPPDYALGFVGKGAFKDVQIAGIPALFVLDADGAVVEFISGYGGSSDHRLEDALDAHLASQPIADPG